MTLTVIFPKKMYKGPTAIRNGLAPLSDREVYLIYRR